MTKLEDIRELISEMGKYCDVIEDCGTSHKAKVAFTKLLIQYSHLVQEKSKKLLAEVEHEQPK